MMECLFILLFAFCALTQVPFMYKIGWKKSFEAYRLNYLSCGFSLGVLFAYILFQVL